MVGLCRCAGSRQTREGRAKVVDCCRQQRQRSKAKITSMHRDLRGKAKMLGSFWKFADLESQTCTLCTLPSLIEGRGRAYCRPAVYLTLSAAPRHSAPKKTLFSCFLRLWRNSSVLGCDNCAISCGSRKTITTSRSVPRHSKI